MTLTCVKLSLHSDLNSGLKDLIVITRKSSVLGIENQFLKTQSFVVPVQGHSGYWQNVYNVSCASSYLRLH